MENRFHPRMEVDNRLRKTSEKRFKLLICQISPSSTPRAPAASNQIKFHSHPLIFSNQCANRLMFYLVSCEPCQLGRSKYPAVWEWDQRPIYNCPLLKGWLEFPLNPLNSKVGWCQHLTIHILCSVDTAAIWPNTQIRNDFKIQVLLSNRMQKIQISYIHNHRQVLVVGNGVAWGEVTSPLRFYMILL